MEKETRNHYLKLVAVFAMMFAIGIVYNKIFNSTESTGKEKKQKKENVDGGPCSYEYDTIPVMILDIDSSNSSYDLQILRCIPSEGNDVCDTFEYSSIMNRNIEKEEWVKCELKKGDSIYFVSGRIISGHCNPENDFLELKKFGQ